MPYLLVGLIVLAVIVLTSLFVEGFGKKVAVYLVLGGATIAGLWARGHHHEIHHIFLVDYPQFLPIPLATILIASLGLFTLKVPDDAKLGWFLFLVCPIIGNFGTTWALVPIGLSLVPALRKQHPQRWFAILMAVCIFSMNMMALATLAADPPQAFWAVKASQQAPPRALGFFFPLTQFWPYLAMTWGVYYVTLRRLNVEFGNWRNLFCIRPQSPRKAAYGLLIATLVGLSITFLKGYEITVVLGGVCVVVALSSLCFGHAEQHATLHWLTETAVVFVAFFSVVAFAHIGLGSLEMPNQGMIGIIAGMTMLADNAAAFAAGYEHFQHAGDVYMVWYNLFPSVVYGGMTPIGNGPQICLFLIILVSLRLTSAREVFTVWLIEACIFLPYLLVWTLATSSLIELGIHPGLALQLLIGLVAAAVCFQFMDLQGKYFRRVVDEGDTARGGHDAWAGPAQSGNGAAVPGRDGMAGGRSGLQGASPISHRPQVPAPGELAT